MLWPSGSARGAFDARSPLAFPVGRSPGFDPTHPIGNLIGGGTTGLPFGNNFRDLATGKIFTKGAGTTSPLVGQIGPSILFNASSAGCLSPASVSLTTGDFTAAAIFQVNGSVANGVIIGTVDYLFIPALVFRSFIGGVGNVLWGFPNAIVGNSYFWAVSGTTNIQLSVLTNLTTGQIYVASQANAGTPSNYTAPTFGNENTASGFFCNCYIAAGMSKPMLSSLTAMRAWAAAPWDFWYPPVSPSPIMTLDSISTQQAPTTILDSYGSVIYRPRARRWGYAA